MIFGHSRKLRSDRRYKLPLKSQETDPEPKLEDYDGSRNRVEQPEKGIYAFSIMFHYPMSSLIG